MKTGFRSRVPSAFGALVMAFLLVVPSLGAQQGGTVTGRVLDSQTGLPLAAVQVFVSALDLGGLTQQNGRYLLQNVPAGTHTLTVARIGYRTAEAQVTVGGGQTVEQNFAMAEEALQLDEIIVTGTPGGTQRRALGNTVASVDVSDIVADVAITNFQDLLSGRTTGLSFTSLTGSVGAGTAMQIRGAGSFTLGQQPLIYVDGVRVNNDNGAGPLVGGGAGANVLDDFNPEDIESVEIIKGPSAASLYGTEASAGVIQIITKKGNVGAPQFNVSIRQGTNFMTNPAKGWATCGPAGRLSSPAKRTTVMVWGGSPETARPKRSSPSTTCTTRGPGTSLWVQPTAASTGPRRTSFRTVTPRATTLTSGEEATQSATSSRPTTRTRRGPSGTTRTRPSGCGRT